MKLNPKLTNLIGLLSPEASRFTLAAILTDGQTSVVTDGHQLTIVKDSQAKPEPKKTLLSREVLDQVKRLPKLKRDEIREIEVTNDENNHQVAVLGAGNSVFSRPRPTGNFPDYERVIPREESMPFRMAFNAVLLKRVLDSMIAMSENKELVPVQFAIGDPERAATLHAPHVGDLDVLAVVMPIRGEADRKPYQRYQEAFGLPEMRPAKESAAEEEAAA